MVRIFLLLTAFLLLSACGAEIPREYSGAVGYSLHSRSTANNTALLNAYTGHICQQAGLSVAYTGKSAGAYPIPHCNITSSAQWQTFVQMGIYDIDRRCDAFLENLYYKEKTREPTIREINDVRNFTVALLEVVAPGSKSIAIVSGALGLGQNTFQNIRGGLLEALDQTTVKALVYGRQKQMKEDISKANVANRPEALNVLRAYLRLCMPHTIEMEANAVLTTFERTGTAGKPLIVATVPKTADDRAEKREFGGKGPSAAAKAFFGPNTTFRDAEVRKVQMNLCTNPDGGIGPDTKAAIYIYRTWNKPIQEYPKDREVRLSQEEAIELLSANRQCDTTKVVNFYENEEFFSKDGKVSQPKVDSVVNPFNVVVNGLSLGPEYRLTGELSSNKSDKFRKSIAKVRETLGIHENIPPYHITPKLKTAIITKAEELISSNSDSGPAADTANGDNGTNGEAKKDGASSDKTSRPTEN